MSDDIETTWLVLRADLLKLKILLEKESPGFITEPLMAIKSLVAAMAKRAAEKEHK